jgi:hypothetical protein
MQPANAERRGGHGQRGPAHPDEAVADGASRGAEVDQGTEGEHRQVCPATNSAAPTGAATG